MRLQGRGQAPTVGMSRPPPPRHDSDVHRGCYMAVRSFNSAAANAGFVRPR